MNFEKYRRTYRESGNARFVLSRRARDFFPRTLRENRAASLVVNSSIFVLEGKCFFPTKRRIYENVGFAKNRRRPSTPWTVTNTCYLHRVVVHLFLLERRFYRCLQFFYKHKNGSLISHCLWNSVVSTIDTQLVSVEIVVWFSSLLGRQNIPKRYYNVPWNRLTLLYEHCISMSILSGRRYRRFFRLRRSNAEENLSFLYPGNDAVVAGKCSGIGLKNKRYR